MKYNLRPRYDLASFSVCIYTNEAVAPFVWLPHKDEFREESTLSLSARKARPRAG